MVKRMPSHRNLQVWQRAMKFVESVYQATETFPRREAYALSDQVRRAVVSIPANIAEGHGRRTDGAFALHLDIALGSLAEVDTLLQVARNLGYLSPARHEALLAELTEIRKMLYGLYRSVRPTRRQP